MSAPEFYEKEHQVREAMRLLLQSSQGGHQPIFDALLRTGALTARLLPVLFGNLHHKPQELQQLAFQLALALEKNAFDVTPLAPELASHLNSAYPHLRTLAAEMLERMGPEAKPAEDYVLGCLRNADRTIALAGLRILRRIGPALSHGIGPRVQAVAELFPGDEEIGELVRAVRTLVDAPAGRALLREIQPRLRGKRILILDDEASYRQTLADALRSAGAIPGEAATGSQGLLMLLRHQSAASALPSAQPPAPTHWDLLLLDIRLPDISGLQVLAALRKHGEKIPVIAVSGVHNDSVVHAAGKYGVQHYILKSTGLSVLLRIVADALAP